MARATPSPLAFALVLALATVAPPAAAQGTADPPPADSGVADGDPGGPGQGRQAQATQSGDPGGGAQGRQGTQRLIPQSAADQPLPQAAPSGDPGGPGQGRQAQVVMADLAPGDDIRFGAAAPAAWGTSTTLPASAAIRAVAGRCAFRFAYRVANVGGAQAPASVARLHLGGSGGPVLATNAIPVLAAGAAAPATGTLWLAPGTSLIYVRADAGGQVAEASEPNNLRRVQVTVSGRCAPPKG